MEIRPEQLAADETTSPQELRKLAQKSLELARIVANNPHTDPELLRELANRSDRTIKEGVTSNPNTPTDVLFKLGSYFPEELLKNPVFSLLFLENLNLFAEIPFITIESLLKQNNIPLFFLEKAAEHPDIKILQIVAQHPQITIPILEKLIKKSELHSFIVQNTNLSTDILKELAKNPISNLILIHHPNTPQYLRLMALTQLSSDRQFAVRKCVALHADTPKNILLHWAMKSEEIDLHEWIANNPSTPTLALYKLASGKPKTRVAVAKNPNTPKNILEKLSTDSDTEVLVGVAVNPNTPKNILETLAKKGGRKILLALLDNPHTSSSIFKTILETEKKSYKHYYSAKDFPKMIQHPNIPKEIQKTLLSNLANSYHYRDRIYAARHPKTPLNILEKLIEDKHPEVRKIARRTLTKHQKQNIF